MMQPEFYDFTPKEFKRFEYITLEIHFVAYRFCNKVASRVI